MKKKREILQLKKANESIMIEGKIGLLPRKLFNCLLFYSLKHFAQDRFVVQKSMVYELVGWKSRDDKELRSALRVLTGTTIEWDIRAGKDSEWGISSLVASAKLHKGEIIFTFSQDLKERLLCPQLYTWLRLEPMKLFTSKYSLALYELLARYAKVGSSGPISLQEFRKLMGTEGEYFNQFKELNRKVIKLALGEINRYSEIRVRLESTGKGRKVTHVKFLIEPNRQPSLYTIQEQLQIEMNPEKDYRKQARECFHSKIGNFGNCGSRWSNHENKEDICRYCQKFSQNVSES